MKSFLRVLRLENMFAAIKSEHNNQKRWFNISSVKIYRRNRANAGLMLGQRRRRWPNIKPALAERLVVADRKPIRVSLQ